MSLTSIWKHNLAKRINATENFKVNLPRPELKRTQCDDARRGPAGRTDAVCKSHRKPAEQHTWAWVWALRWFRMPLHPEARDADSGLSLGVTAAPTSQRGDGTAHTQEPWELSPGTGGSGRSRWHRPPWRWARDRLREHQQWGTLVSVDQPKFPKASGVSTFLQTSHLLKPPITTAWRACSGQCSPHRNKT